MLILFIVSSLSACAGFFLCALFTAGRSADYESAISSLRRERDELLMRKDAEKWLN